MIYAILTSISSMVLHNSLSNYLAKRKFTTNLSAITVNFLSYLVCIVAFGILMITDNISLYTVVTGVIFGVVTLISAQYKLLALNKGPMHLTLLFTTSSMIIPSLSGAFFGEKLSVFKVLTILVLIFFLYLSFEKNNSTKAQKSWFFFTFLAFLFQGAIGILQKIHQASAHKDESSGFLFVAFICAVVFCLIQSKGKLDTQVSDKKVLFICFICGVCVFIMNYINLKLSGIMPSQLFFPLINGSTIVASSLVSVFLFKEKLSPRQSIGITGGIISLIAICFVQ